MGKGDDTVIFDNLNDSRAGLSISDKVSGGEGNDTLVIDGDGKKISISASEWTNVSSMENIRLVGNDQEADNSLGGVNAYNLTLTNQLIDDNAADGNMINIINDNGDSADAAANSGVTIDATQLSSDNNFSYDGQETQFLQMEQKLQR